MISPAIQHDILKLAPMPVSVVRLARMAGDYSSHIDEIIRVIELDPALTANVLRLANSAWCATAYPILTVKAAVVRLGLARILWFAVGRRVAEPMRRPCPGYWLGEGELWRHSVASALAAEHLGRATGNQVPGVAFTASLLHDLGKLILGRRLGRDDVERIRDMMVREQISHVEAERRLVGMDHAEVGGAIALNWNFPKPLVAAIARHHDLGGQTDLLKDAIQVSNLVSKLIGVGLGSEEMNVQVDDQSPRRLGLTAAGLESTCALVADDLGRVSELCGRETHGTERAGCR